jgi:uncharacterized protein
MVDAELLAILVCPETHAAVSLADAGVLARVNAAIAGGTLRTRGGDVVKAPLEAGLLREDGLVLYPIRDDIPVMLIDESIPLEPLP